MNKQLVRQVLLDLLQIPIGHRLPNRSGICLELGLAAKAWHRYRGQCITSLASDTAEYIWCYNECKRVHHSSICDLDLGTMTEKRHQFCIHLLEKINKEIADDNQ